MLEIFVIVIEVIVLAANILWEHLGIFVTRESAFEWFVASQFTLIFAYMFIRCRLDKLQSNDVRKLIQSLKPLLTHNATVLRQDEFYSDFREKIAHAKFTIDISHLETFSPADEALPGSATQKYYDEFKKLIRSRPQVRFRRVERISSQKLRWIESLVRVMAGQANCSLACLITAAEPRKLPTMSVQLIDNDITYLVAITEHTEAHLARDLRICDPAATEVWLTYYELMLWRDAVKVIENGNVDQDALARVRAEMAERQG